MLALLNNGDVYSWGKNDMGEIGNNGSVNVTSPYKVTVPIDPGDRIVSVNAGYEHSSALTASGKLYCWGNQQDGRLGNGVTSGYQRAPVYIRSNVASITDGGSYRYQIIIQPNGEAWAAGHDQYGKMGNDKDLGLTDASSNTKGFVIVEFQR
jgi:alpha-tubulin suppressor-like RCC1 family protein